jgi:methylmalonyl-CoA mutase N-terminal domain/subunit
MRRQNLGFYEQDKGARAGHLWGGVSMAKRAKSGGAAKPVPLPLSDFAEARGRWRAEVQAGFGRKANPRNRSGIEVQPLYTPEDWPDDAGGERYMQALGFPGQLPMTRGIYPTMHRGRTWTQRQLIGLGVPEDYNARLKTILAHGGTAISLIPCNSVYRGYDADGVPPEILGTCGVTVNTAEDMTICLDGIPIGDISTALNDPSPFTLLALELTVAKRRGIPWTRISGTSNQSDYLSHFVANHMFFRLALPGARRVLLDHIAFCRQHVPQWNPLSIVGQHMQQAGATPAEAMGLTLSSAIQYAGDCLARGWDPDQFLPRFTFFFDISVSFFEEVAKFRAGRRIWARLARERFGAKDARSWRFKFHGQTSGVDLTRQQPLNNIARVTVQTLAAVLGGCQSLHTNSFDEALGLPTSEAATIALRTQQIVAHEAGVADFVDALGGSYAVEALTDRIEKAANKYIARIDELGGMVSAIEQGYPQREIQNTAYAFQLEIEKKKRLIVGQNAFIQDAAPVPVMKIDKAIEQEQIERVRTVRATRDAKAFAATLSKIEAAARGKDNLVPLILDAVRARATVGEISGVLRDVWGEHVETLVL